MEKLALNSIKRTSEENLKTLRASSKIPAVIYGHKFAPISLSLDYSEFLKTFRISGKTHILKLSIDGKNQDALVHTVQYHPVTGDFQHIDFMAIDAKEKIHVSIPLLLVGNSIAIRDGGMATQLVQEIEVKCFPADLVDHFEYDISVMTEIGMVAHLSELNINEKIFEVHLDPETPIVSMLAQRSAVSVEEDTTAPVTPEATEEEKTTEA